MQPPNPLVSVWVMVACTGAQTGLSFDAQLHGVHSTYSSDHPDHLRRRFDDFQKSCPSTSSCAEWSAGELELSSHAALLLRRVFVSSRFMVGLMSQRKRWNPPESPSSKPAPLLLRSRRDDLEGKGCYGDFSMKELHKTESTMPTSNIRC